MARPSSYGAANRPVMADRTGCRVFLVRKRARQRLLGKEKPLGSSPQTHATAGAPAKTCAVTLPASVAFSVSYQQHGRRRSRA